MRALCTTLVMLIATATVAVADGLPAEVRSMAERAFLEGRYDDLDTTLAGAKTEVDRYPLVLYGTSWRLREGYEPPTDPVVPATGGGELPWPLLTALSLDRHAREIQGSAGLPESGALMTYRQGLHEERDGETIWYLEDVFRLMRETYGPPEPLPQQELRTYRGLRDKAKMAALATLAAFTTFCFVGAVVVARNRRPEDD